MITNMGVTAYDDLVRRLAAAGRSATLYAPAHPLVQRGLDALDAHCTALTQQSDSVVVGFIGDEVVANAVRLPKSAARTGFARDMREREVEKITLRRGVTKDELRTLIFELADRRAGHPLGMRLEEKGVQRADGSGT